MAASADDEQTIDHAEDRGQHHRDEDPSQTGSPYVVTQMPMTCSEADERAD
jgi:hypothetical protein